MELRYTRKCFKVRYNNRQEAKKARKQINRIDVFDLQDVYYCDECQGYHLTTMNKTDSRNLNRKKKR